MISCGHCKGKHETVAQVRECSTVKTFPIADSPFVGVQINQYGSAARTYPATEKQINFIKSLIARKSDHSFTEDMDLAQLNKRTASEVIASMLLLPDKVIAKAEAKQDVNVPDGYYAINHEDGVTRFYKVNTPADGKWARRTFIKIQAGSEYHPIRNRDHRSALLLEIAVNPKAAGKLYADRIGNCYMCNRTLTDHVSREIGLGPICRNK